MSSFPFARHPWTFLLTNLFSLLILKTKSAPPTKNLVTDLKQKKKKSVDYWWVYLSIVPITLIFDSFSLSLSWEEGRRWDLRRMVSRICRLDTPKTQIDVSSTLCVVFSPTSSYSSSVIFKNTSFVRDSNFLNISPFIFHFLHR